MILVAPGPSRGHPGSCTGARGRRRHGRCGCRRSRHERLAGCLAACSNAGADAPGSLRRAGSAHVGQREPFHNFVMVLRRRATRPSRILPVVHRSQYRCRSLGVYRSGYIVIFRMYSIGYIGFSPAARGFHEVPVQQNLSINRRWKVPSLHLQKQLKVFLKRSPSNGD